MFLRPPRRRTYLAIAALPITVLACFYLAGAFDRQTAMPSESLSAPQEFHYQLWKRQWLPAFTTNQESNFIMRLLSETPVDVTQWCGFAAEGQITPHEATLCGDDDPNRPAGTGPALTTK